MSDDRSTPHWPAVDLSNHDRSDNSSGDPVPTSYADAEYQKGVTDGRVGLRTKNLDSVFRLVAGRRHEEDLRDLAQKVTTAESERDILAVHYYQCLQDASWTDEVLIDLERHRLDSPSSYSFLLGVLYCFVALILWIADLPLSLLAADGLDIRTNYVAFADLSQVWNNWTTMWEPLAFAVGIAALGLFFKFVADQFVKPAVRKGRVMKIAAAVLLLGVIGLITANLYYLAQLRAGVKVLHEMQRRAATQPGLAPQIDALNLQMQERASIAFILLTLTLPVIGGICASVGWSRMQNARTVGRLRRKAKQERAAAKDALQRKHLSEGVLRAAKEEREAVQARSLDGVVEAAHTLYEDGFTRGLLVPETVHDGRRLHERLEIAVGRWLAIAHRRSSTTADHGNEGRA